MKSLKQLFFLIRDEATESLKPGLLSTLARVVYFPDGKTLLEKWETEVKKTLEIKHTTEVTTLDTNSFKWSCTKYGDKKFSISLRVRPSVDNIPESIDNGSELEAGSITITKMDENGNIYEEHINYGNNGIIEQYRFPIALPEKFAEGRSFNLAASTVNLTEGADSHFITKHTVHNCYTEIKNGVLNIYVNHFKNMDGIDLSDLPYITGDFSVIIDGVFL